MKKSVWLGAFSLVEVAVALGVAAFCLIAVFALLPVGMNANRNAIAQSAAIDILSAVTSDLRATPNSSNTSSLFGITFGTAKTLYLDSTGSVTSDDAQKVYRLAVTFPSNPSGNHAATFADLMLTWPYAIDPSTATPAGSAEIFAAFDRH